MWDTITQISTGLSLLAFVFALTYTAYQRKLRSTERLIQSASPKDRAALVQSALEMFNVDTSRLTKEQSFNIAVEQIRARSKRYTITAISLLFAFVITAIFAAISVLNTKTKGGANDIKATIERPIMGASYPEHYRIRLAGSAFDPATGTLKKADLRWLDEGTVLGTGADLEVDSLKPGRHRLIFEAENIHGDRQSSYVDITINATKTILSKIDFVSFSEPCHVVGISDELLVAGTSSNGHMELDRLHLYQIDSHAKIAEVSNLQLPSPERILSLGKRFAITSATATVFLVDASNPKIPFISDMLKIGSLGAIFDAAKLTENLIVVRGTLGWGILSVSSDGKLNQITSIPNEAGMNNGIGVNRGIVYLPSRYAGLSLFLINDLNHPDHLATIPGDSSKFSTNVLFQGDFAYANSWSGDLEVIYVADPSHPKVLSNLEGTGNVQRMDMIDSKIFTAGLSSGLQIVDVSIPSMPVLDSTYPLKFVSDVAVFGHKVVTCSDQSLILFELKS